MTVAPAHGCLNHEMQHVEMNAEGHRHDAADLGHDLVDGDLQVGNLLGLIAHWLGHGDTVAVMHGGWR